MGSLRIFIPVLLALFIAATSIHGVEAGGAKPGCAGNLCGHPGRTFHPDPIGIHLPGAVCPVGYFACTNLEELDRERLFSSPLQNALEWAFGPIRDAPYAVYGGMGSVTPKEELVADLTGGLASEFPKLLLDLIGDATPNLPPVLGSVRLRPRGVGVGHQVGRPRAVAAALADTIPDFPPVRGERLGREFDVRALVESGEIAFESRVRNLGDMNTIAITARHGSSIVGDYALTQFGNTLDITNLQTLKAYEGGGMATKAVADYMGLHPEITHLSATVVNRPTVQFIDAMLEKATPAQFMPQALQTTPLGKIGSRLGGVRLVEMKKGSAYGSGGNTYDILVELLR